MTGPAAPVVECTGDGLDRGLAHGEQLRERVRAAVERWSEDTLRRQRAGTDMRAYARALLAGTGLLASIEATVPDLMREIEGIALGAALPFELVAAYNLMDEQWWYDLPVPSDSEPGCSVVGHPIPGGMLLAQNMDLPAWFDGAQVLLRLGPPGRPEVLVLSAAGMVGLTGVSAAGFAVCVNTLLTLRHDRAGVPVIAVLRHALDAEDSATAVSRIRGLRHASGQHYAVADAADVTGLECSAGGAVLSHPASRATLRHTNHPTASDDVDAAKQELLRSTGRLADSTRRLDVLRADPRVDGDAVEVGEALRDPRSALCVRPSGGRTLQTFASVSYELGDAPRTRVRLGAPGCGEWVTVDP